MDPPTDKTVRADAASYAIRAGSREIVCVVAYLVMAGSVGSAQPAARPDFVLIAQAVGDYFNSREEYRAGDLLTQPHIEQALEKVQDAGWKVADAPRIAKLGLADNSFLAREFSTAAGRKFMRKVARHAGAYSRLDRLSSISRGKTIIRDLIHQPDGDKLIEYLASTQSGHNLGSMLAGAGRGVDLNKPTGRIYTADDLLAELKRSYAKEFAR